MRSAADSGARPHTSDRAWSLPTCTARIKQVKKTWNCWCASSRQENMDTRAVQRKADNKPMEQRKPPNVTNIKGASPPSRELASRQDQARGDRRAPLRVDEASVKKRIVSPPDNDQLPKMAALIIVEGLSDCVAVHRAVRSPVYVLGGGYALAEEMKPQIQYIASLAASGQLPRNVVVFTDPDWQGRMFRTYLDDVLRQPSSAPGPVPGAPSSGQATRSPRLLPAAEARNSQGSKALVIRHAFLRVEEGTSEEASRYHEAGNVGVEHASPDTLRTCLVRARPGFGPGRTEFSVEELRADGLVGSWDDKDKVAGPQLRRARFCRALGIDEVGTGKGLVNLLNRFFTREDYVAALKVATGADS